MLFLDDDPPERSVNHAPGEGDPLDLQVIDEHDD